MQSFLVFQETESIRNLQTHIKGEIHQCCIAFSRNCSFSLPKDFIEFFQMWFEDVCFINKVRLTWIYVMLSCQNSPATSLQSNRGNPA